MATRTVTDRFNVLSNIINSNKSNSIVICTIAKTYKFSDKHLALIKLNQLLTEESTIGISNLIDSNNNPYSLTSYPSKDVIKFQLFN